MILIMEEETLGLILNIVSINSNLVNYFVS